MWQTTRPVRRRLRKLRFRLLGDRGATTLEFALLLAAVVLPSYAIIRLGLQLVAEHFRLIATLNALPTP